MTAFTDLGANAEDNAVQYRMVLTLVVLELLLAFGVGVSCVLLSLFLLRKVFEEESEAELSPLSARDSESGAGLRPRPHYSSVAGSERSRSDAGENSSLNGQTDSVQSSDSPWQVSSWLKWLTAR